MIEWDTPLKAVRPTVAKLVRELRHLLERVVEQLNRYRAVPQSGTVRDTNGNTVGEWRIEGGQE